MVGVQWSLYIYIILCNSPRIPIPLYPVFRIPEADLWLARNEGTEVFSNGNYYNELYRNYYSDSLSFPKVRKGFKTTATATATAGS